MNPNISTPNEGLKHPNDQIKTTSLSKQSPAIPLVANLAILILLYLFFPLILFLTALTGQPASDPGLGFTLRIYTLLMIFLLILILFVIFSICGSLLVLKNGESKERFRAVLSLVILNFLLFILLPFPLVVFISASGFIGDQVLVYQGIAPFIFVLFNFRISMLVSSSIDKIRIEKYKRILLIILCGYFILFLLSMLIDTKGNKTIKTSQIKTEQSQSTPKLLTVDERDYKRKNDLNSMQSFITTYKREKGNFPQSLSQIVGPDYISRLPMEPLTNNTYTYTLNQNSTDYQLCAAFESIKQKCINSSTIAWNLK